MNAAPSSARRIGIGALTVAVLTLTGCAAGQHAQTADEVPVVDGVMANAGPIALRAVTVAPPTDNSFPANGDAPMQMVIINDGAADDQLESVTTSAASQVRFFSSLPAADTSAPASSDSSAPASTDSSSPETTPSETPSSGESSSSTSSSASSDVGSIESINLPMGRATSIGYTPDLPQIQLHGLTSQLFPSETFPITFQFAKAGSVTFTVSVHLAPGPSSTPTLDVAPTAAD